MHVLWGKDSNGVWHISVGQRETMTEIDTKCGKHLTVVALASSRDPYIKRDVLCAQCRETKGDA